MLDLSRRYPDTNAGLGVNVKPLHEQITGGVRSLLHLLQLAVGMMLLIACANVAHLLLGQAAGRSGEMTTRTALGAGRARLVRQMLAETLVLASSGRPARPRDRRGQPERAPRRGSRRLAAGERNPARSDRAGLHDRAHVTTAIVFGLGPAIQLARQGTLSPASSTLRLAGSRQVRRWHHAIVVTELVLAQMLLVGAGLLLASFLASQRVPLGFESVRADCRRSESCTRPLLATDCPGVVPDRSGAEDRVRQHGPERLRSSPGVRAAAASFTSPLTGAPNRGISLDRQARKHPDRKTRRTFSW